MKVRFQSSVVVPNSVIAGLGSPASTPGIPPHASFRRLPTLFWASSSDLSLEFPGLDRNSAGGLPRPITLSPVSRPETGLWSEGNVEGAAAAIRINGTVLREGTGRARFGRRTGTGGPGTNSFATEDGKTSF